MTGKFLAGVTALPYLGQLRCLRTAQAWPSGEIHRAQSERLTTLFNHARIHTAYYRSLLGASGGNIASRFSLADFPLIGKEDLRIQPDAFRAKPRGKVYARTSGGSTGEPTRVFLDSHYLQWNRASKVLFDGWTDYRAGQHKVVLWGARQDTHPKKRPLSVLARLLRNEEWIDAYDMSEESAARYLDRMRTAPPRLLLGYAESLDALASLGQKLGIRGPQVGAVMSSAGTLFPDMRERISGYFNAPVFNRYGAREVGDIAAECSAHEGLHVNPLTHYVELLRPDGSPARRGEIGEVVVTLLTNYAMPLIRYRIGDVATWAEAPCSCGCAWPILKQVEGRVTDHFVSMSGDLIHGGRLRTLLFDEDWIARYQWIQESKQLTHLLVVLRDEVSPDDVAGRAALVQHAALEVLGADVDVQLEFVDAIQPGPTGKHRFTISNVHQ